jgi:hypothetical protein
MNIKMEAPVFYVTVDLGSKDRKYLTSDGRWSIHLFEARVTPAYANRVPKKYAQKARFQAMKWSDCK